MIKRVIKSLLGLDVLTNSPPVMVPAEMDTLRQLADAGLPNPSYLGSLGPCYLGPATPSLGPCYLGPCYNLDWSAPAPAPRKPKKMPCPYCGAMNKFKRTTCKACGGPLHEEGSNANA